MCEHTVYGSGFSRIVGRRCAKSSLPGTNYCAAHSPAAQLKREAERRARVDAEIAARHRRANQMGEMQRKANAYDGLAEALRRTTLQLEAVATHLREHGHHGMAPHCEAEAEQGRAALAKGGAA